MKIEHAESQLYFFNNKFEHDLLKEFLTTYQSSEEKNRRGGGYKYLNLIQKIKNKELNFLEIHQEDLDEFLSSKGDKGKKLYHNVINNSKRYIGLMSNIANSLENIHRTTPLTHEEEFD